MRLLTDTKPWRRLPMRKTKENGFLVACVHKDDSGEFHLHLNENIWGSPQSSPPSVEVVYSDIDTLVSGGWEID